MNGRWPSLTGDGGYIVSDAEMRKIVNKVTTIIREEIASKRLIHPDRLDSLFKGVERRLAQEIPRLKPTPIDDLDLKVRTYNILKRADILFAEDIIDILYRGPDAMLAVRNFGEKALDEVIEKLKERGYEIQNEWLYSASR